MSEERKKHINHLKAMLKCYENQTSPTTRCDDCDNCELQYAQGNMGEIKETLAYAISSLETDEAYQLEYERTTKNNLAVDKEQLKTMIRGLTKWYVKRDNTEVGEPNTAVGLLYDDVMFGIDRLPSVTPQEPKTGHWTEEFNDLEGEVRFTCSSCGKYQLFGTDFCYHCGSDNREVVEE